MLTSGIAATISFFFLLFYYNFICTHFHQIKRIEAIKLELLCFLTIKVTNLIVSEPMIYPSITFEELSQSFLKKTSPSILGFQVPSIYLPNYLPIYLLS